MIILLRARTHPIMLVSFLYYVKIIAYTLLPRELRGCRFTPYAIAIKLLALL